MRTRAMDELRHGLEWSRDKVGDLRESLPWTCARKERSTLSVVLGVTLVLAVIAGVAMWVSRRLAEEDESLTETRGDGLEAAATEDGEEQPRARGAWGRHKERDLAEGV